MTGKGTWGRRSEGFGLVELMVALLLGILVLGAVLAVYLSNTQAAKFQTGLMRVQENGRFAIDVLSRSIRMAGYDDPDGSAKINTPIQGTNNATGIKWSQTGLKTDGDTLTISYEGGDGIRDCRGTNVTINNDVFNQFAVWVDEDGVGHLVCSTAANSREALAEGVEDMVLLYGVDTDDDGVANRYVDANDVGGWANVVSVQATLLVNSIDGGAPQSDTICLGCTVFSGTADGLIRAEFQTTVGIRN